MMSFMKKSDINGETLNLNDETIGNQTLISKNIASFFGKQREANITNDKLYYDQGTMTDQIDIIQEDQL